MERRSGDDAENIGELSLTSLISICSTQLSARLNYHYHVIYIPQVETVKHSTEIYARRVFKNV